MKPLAIFRRGLKKVWDGGYPTSNKKFSDLLGKILILSQFT